MAGDDKRITNTVFKELYDYREMVFSLVRRDLRGRYKGTVLGFMWTFFNPLMQLVVYTIVFSFIMRMGIEKGSSGVMVGKITRIPSIYADYVVLGFRLLPMIITSPFKDDCQNHYCKT